MLSTRLVIAVHVSECQSQLGKGAGPVLLENDKDPELETVGSLDSRTSAEMVVLIAKF